MARLGFLLPMNLSFFGGGAGEGGFRRPRKRRQTGNTPGNNQTQNKQFKDAVNELKREGINLDKDQQERLHRAISGQGLGFREIIEMARSLFS